VLLAGVLLVLLVLVVQVASANDTPVAVIDIFPDTQGTVGEFFGFSAERSTDPDGTIGQYSWDFGDGGFGLSIWPWMNYSYSHSGQFVVTLRVTDNENATGTAVIIVTVVPRLNRAPVITSFLPPDNEVFTGPGDPTVFSVNAVDFDGDTLMYTWIVNGLVQSVSDSVFVFAGSPEDAVVEVVVSDGLLEARQVWIVSTVQHSVPPPAFSIPPVLIALGLVVLVGGVVVTLAYTQTRSVPYRPAPTPVPGAVPRWCLRCGAAYPAQGYFCPACGERLSGRARPVKD